MKMLLGLRNHFKDPSHASYNLENDGVFPKQALDSGFLLANRNTGRLLRSNNEFPRVPVHFIDSHNPAAMIGLSKTPRFGALMASRRTR